MSKINATKPTAAITAAAMGFISKATADEFARDDSPDGSHHAIRATLAVEIDGSVIITREYEGTTDTGHASLRASSVGAKAGEVLAYVASKMNKATREALYRELADVFAANGGKLPVTTESVEEADEALGRLRQKTEQAVRGTFKVSARRVDVDRDGKQVPASGSTAAAIDSTTPPDVTPAASATPAKPTRKARKS